MEKTIATTILVPEKAMKELREIARADRRSLGFVFRDALAAWLAGRRDQAEKS
jgi:hypothetical protein